MGARELTAPAVGGAPLGCDGDDGPQRVRAWASQSSTGLPLLPDPGRGCVAAAAVELGERLAPGSLLAAVGQSHASDGQNATDTPLSPPLLEGIAAVDVASHDDTDERDPTSLGRGALPGAADAIGSALSGARRTSVRHTLLLSALSAIPASSRTPPTLALSS